MTASFPLVTCVEDASGKLSAEVDGKSLFPLLHDHQDRVHEALFWDQGTNERSDWAIRVGPWKLREVPGSGATRTYCGAESYNRPTAARNGLVFYNYPTPSGMLLYNLDEDPGEQHNLAARMPDKVTQMTKLHQS